jgi:hypothetical protein
MQRLVANLGATLLGSPVGLAAEPEPEGSTTYTSAHVDSYVFDEARGHLTAYGVGVGRRNEAGSSLGLRFSLLPGPFPEAARTSGIDLGWVAMVDLRPTAILSPRSELFLVCDVGVVMAVSETADVANTAQGVASVGAGVRRLYRRPNGEHWSFSAQISALPAVFEAKDRVRLLAPGAGITVRRVTVPR